MRPTGKSKGRYICLEMMLIKNGFFSKGVLRNFKVRTVVVVIKLKKSDEVSNKEKGTLLKQLIFFVYKAERM